MTSEADTRQPKKQNCLVLGAGFIGSHIAEELVCQGYPVRVFSRTAKPLTGRREIDQQIDFVVGDFLDRKALRAALQSVEVVIHCIGTSLPAESNLDPVQDVQTTIVGALGLLEEATKLGNSVIIYISSGGTVYGIPQSNPISESHPTSPVCSYGITNLAVEKYLYLFYHLHGVRYYILRCANPYGERQDLGRRQGVIAAMLNAALTEQPFEIWGDGSVIRDYFHVDDLGVAVCKLLERMPSTRLMNVGSGRGISLNDLLEVVEGVMGRKLVVNYSASRPFDVPINVLDITLAQQVLGWKPDIGLEEGCLRYWLWLNKQRARTYG